MFSVPCLPPLEISNDGSRSLVVEAISHSILRPLSFSSESTHSPTGCKYYCCRHFPLSSKVIPVHKAVQEFKEDRDVCLSFESGSEFPRIRLGVDCANRLRTMNISSSVNCCVRQVSRLIMPNGRALPLRAKCLFACTFSLFGHIYQAFNENTPFWRIAVCETHTAVKNSLDEGSKDILTSLLHYNAIEPMILTTLLEKHPSGLSSVCTLSQLFSSSQVLANRNSSD